jgi:hypothetical protein
VAQLIRATLTRRNEPDGRHPRSVGFFFSAPFLFRHELIRTESLSQPPHPDADIILRTHLAPVRAITRKHAELR